jgi:hypothetical protein|uniref:Uncharacterized protein n=1 Tax=viral metagenome TaxID=1070528 RepID=A0A6C0BKH0_9ZZZZ
MEHFKQCSLKELEEIMYDLRNWKRLDAKIDSIMETLEDLPYSSPPLTDNTRVMVSAMTAIEKQCLIMDQTMNAKFNQHGITEDNLEDVMETVFSLLKQKITQSLHQSRQIKQPHLSEQLLYKYVDAFFQYNEAPKYLIGTVDEVTHWINQNLQVLRKMYEKID